jgi:type I restriction enzyme, S subunit
MARNTIYPPSVKPGIPRLGAKPKGWIETTLGDVLRVVQRPAKIKDNIEYQLVTAKRSRGGIVPRETLTGKKILTKIQYYVAKNDFLISKRQIVHGACGIVPSTLDGALVSGEYSVLRVKNGILLKYLDYLSHTDYFQMACFQASVGVDVEKMIFDLKEWLNFKIYLPPIIEQQKIVDILSTWDKSIAQSEQLIFIKQILKKGLLQKLFTGKISICNNKKWKESRLEEVCIEFLSGGTPSTTVDNYWQGNIPWITGSDFGDLRIDNIRSHITKEAVKNSATKIVGKDNLLVVTRVGVGKLAIAPFDIAISQDTTGLIIDKQLVNPKFLLYALALTIPHLAKYNQGTSIQGVTRRDLRQHKIMLPPLEIQQRIAEILHTIQDEIDLLIARQDFYKKQKKGLMKKLLGGKVRVKI